MKYVLVTLAIMFLGVACDAERHEVASQKSAPAASPAPEKAQRPAAASRKQEEIALAKTAIQVFAGELKAELTRAMQAGGPVAAIGVCKTEAMPITDRVAAEHGLKLGRVSLKNRNPENAPNEWQTAVLEDFERRKLAGEDAAGISWADFADNDGRQEFRMMKAIPTGGLCLKCHGTKIAAEVSEVLAGLYPADLATGFQEGDLRGAFVVTR